MIHPPWLDQQLPLLDKMLKIWNMKKDAAAEGTISLHLPHLYILETPADPFSDQKTQNQRCANPRSKRFHNYPQHNLPPLDLTELSLPSTMKISFPNPDDILNFTLTIEPDEGISLSCKSDFTNDSRHVQGRFF